MFKRSVVSNLLFIFLIHGSLFSRIPQADIDTSSINRQTEQAYISSRSNPDLSIMQAHSALRVSNSINYSRGIADASLALGMAYFAKYNPGDSSYFYNIQALDLYRDLGNYQGMGRACYTLAYVFSLKGNIRESERYSSLSLDYFREAGDSRGIINAYNVLSYLAQQQNDLEKARELIEEAITTARSVKDTLSLADALNSLGNIYKNMALFNQAINSYFEALRLWELKGDSTGLSIAYGSIGLMYYYQQDWDRALEFDLQKLSISEALGDLWEVSKTLNNISQIYSSRAQFDTSLYYIRRAMNLNLDMGYQSGIAAAYHNMASTLLQMSQIDSAFYYATKAVKISREINDPGLMNSLLTLAQVYRTRKDYNSALKNAHEAYNLASKQKLPIVIGQASSILSDLYSITGRSDLAYGYLKEFFLINDSINNNEYHKQVTRLEIEYEYDQRQKAAEYARMQERIVNENRLKQQGLYLRGLVILLVLLAIISILFIRHNRVRSKYDRIDLEQKLLRAQMNPHFIFNSLCAVQDFILSGKSQMANAFLTKIASLMRNILEQTSEEYIPLEKEIETLRLYLEVQKLRFEKEFEYTLIMDKEIDPQNLSVPPMLAQPCVENSIEHGLLKSKHSGLLQISYHHVNGLLMLEVTDNGVGRKRASEISGSRMKRNSISTKLTEKRLMHFRKVLKEKSISYEIIDLYEGDDPAGTKVIMKLPYKKIYA